VPGRDLANTFSSLRANDLVWNYVVNNYLEGRPPPAFDLLFWNGDSTNLPGPMYAWYLRNTYLENNLVVPEQVSVCAAPWTWVGSRRRLTCSRHARITSFLEGRVRFRQALTGVAEGELEFVRGHGAHRRHDQFGGKESGANYWISQQTPLPERADDWFDLAQEMPGSWWIHWDAGVRVCRRRGGRPWWLTAASNSAD